MMIMVILSGGRHRGMRRSRVHYRLMFDGLELWCTVEVVEK